MQPARQCCHGDVRAVWAALPNVGEHLRLALTPSTGKTKVAQFQQRRIIIRQQRVVELQVSVQHRTAGEPLTRRCKVGQAYPICVCMLASSLFSHLLAKPKSHSLIMGGLPSVSSVLSSFKSLAQHSRAPIRPTQTGPAHALITVPL